MNLKPPPGIQATAERTAGFRPLRAHLGRARRNHSTCLGPRLTRSRMNPAVRLDGAGFRSFAPSPSAEIGGRYGYSPGKCTRGQQPRRLGA